MRKLTLRSAICVDASVVVRVVLAPTPPVVQRLWSDWQQAGREILAPSLLLYELTNALYRYQRAGVASPVLMQEALSLALSLPIRLHSEPELHQEAMNWAARLGLPAVYDAHYIALASRLGAELWTADRRLARAAHLQLPWVHLVDSTAPDPPIP